MVGPPGTATVAGWTYQQWAIAAGRFKVSRIHSWKHAEQLRARWDRTHTVEPGEVQLHGIEYPTEPRAAYDVFLLAGGTDSQDLPVYDEERAKPHTSFGDH